MTSRLLLATFVTFVLCSPASFAQAEGEHPAVGVIRKTCQAVEQLLDNEGLSKEKKRLRFQKLIEQELAVDRVSRSILKDSWKRFDEPQKREFKQLFVPYLVSKYWKKVRSGQGLVIDIVGDGKEHESSDTHWRVKTKVKTADSKASIHFVLHHQDAKVWKIVDIVVDDVSQVATNSDDFTSIVKRDGPDGLLKMLREKAGG